MTIADLVRRAAGALRAAGFTAEASRIDAEVLVRHLVRWDTSEWLVRLRDPAPPGLSGALDATLARRIAHEPVAYIIGTREFYGRTFEVGPGVLVPRPDTEIVVSEALRAIAERRAETTRRPIRVADVGTGSGCLAVTVALECPDVDVIATDVSPAALRIAEGNAARLGAAARVRFRRAALLGGDAISYDVVMSNPPYVAEADRDRLMPDVRDHEPALALFAGSDGLAVIRDLLPEAERTLRPGGWLVMEIGSTQAPMVTALLRDRPRLSLVKVADDLAGLPRVVVARRPPRPSHASRTPVRIIGP